MKKEVHIIISSPEPGKVSQSFQLHLDARDPEAAAEAMTRAADKLFHAVEGSKASDYAISQARRCADSLRELQRALAPQRWTGCGDCSRMDKHHHCNECGATDHGAAYCDNGG